jgi:ParB family chromosome partitioning protein
MKFEEIRVAACSPFEDNPFKVKDDLEMEMLIQSIKENGVLSPIMVRPQAGDGYEIISGHRRVYACRKAGIETIPALIHEMSRDEAVIRLVDSNLQRESLLPSEKAFAYKMKMEALRHQGRSGQDGQKWSRDEVTDSESGRTVQRYIRLTCLEQPLLNLVDEGRVALTPAVELSYLRPEEQEAVIEVFQSDEVTPSYSQSVRMRKLSEMGLLTKDKVFEIMTEVKGNQKEYLKLPVERYERFLGRFHTQKDKEDFIMKALDYYTRHLERLRSRDAR